MRVHLACLLALPCFTGCFIDAGPDDPPGDDDGSGSTACSTEPTYSIDTGASISYQAGVDAGYYAAYNGAGAWHFEWTCDTAVSAVGCTFSGSITAPTPAGGLDATCFQCEAADQLTTTPDGASTEIDFVTTTTTGIDGVDFTTNPGAGIEINFEVNDLYQDDLVYLPSNGATVTPSCMPVLLQPSTP